MHICVFAVFLLCLYWRLGGLLLVSAEPIMKEKTVKSEILIICGRQGIGSKRRARVGGKEGGDMEKIRKRGNAISSHPRADKERMYGD